EHRGGDLGVADADADRHLAPVDQAAGCLLEILAFLRRHGHEEVRRRSAPLDHLAGEGPLHAPIIGDVPMRRGRGSMPEVCQSHVRRLTLLPRTANAASGTIWPR